MGTNESEKLLPDGIPIVCNGQMILELMEAHPHRLASIVEEGGWNVPPSMRRIVFLRLGHIDDLVVACSSPKSLVVLNATRLIRLGRPHLRLAKVLQGTISPGRSGAIVG